MDNCVHLGCFLPPVQVPICFLPKSRWALRHTSLTCLYCICNLGLLCKTPEVHFSSLHNSLKFNSQGSFGESEGIFQILHFQEQHDYQGHNHIFISAPFASRNARQQMRGSHETLCVVCMSHQDATLLLELCLLQILLPVFQG